MELEYFWKNCKVELDNFGNLQRRVCEIRNRIGCPPSASVANTHNCTNVCTLLLCLILQQTSTSKQQYDSRLHKWQSKGGVCGKL